MRRLLALLLPLLLVAAACGDDDADEAAPGTTSPVADGSSTAEQGAAEDDPADGDELAEPPSAPPTTVATDAPAGEAPAGAGEDDGSGDALLVADLTPDAEVPGPGATGATGRFEAELVDGVLCVELAVRGLGGPVSGAHVHEGAADAAGPVLVDLGEPTATTTDSVTWTDACQEVGDDVIERLAGAPEQHYVNVHTSAFPEGAVRGQLSVASVFDRTLG